MKRKTSTSDKFRCWSCITYLSSYQLQRRLDSMLSFTSLLYYAYIYHDKDTDDEGNLLEPHIHLCLYFRYPVRCVRDYLIDFHNNAGNAFCEPLNNRYSMVYEYFIHHNNPEKYQYDFSSVVSNDIDFWDNDFSGTSNDVSVSIVEDMLRGVPYIDLVRTYGKSFVYHYNNYRSVVEEIKIQTFLKK